MANFHLGIKEQKRAKLSGCQRGQRFCSRQLCFHNTYTIVPVFTMPICTTYATLSHSEGICPLRITAHISHCGLHVYACCKGRIAFPFISFVFFSFFLFCFVPQLQCLKCSNILIFLKHLVQEFFFLVRGHLHRTKH